MNEDWAHIRAVQNFNEDRKQVISTICRDKFIPGSPIKDTAITVSNTGDMNPY